MVKIYKLMQTPQYEEFFFMTLFQIILYILLTLLNTN